MMKKLKKQKCKEQGEEEPTHPYYGACGGSYSYIFTQSSLGIVKHIRNNLTKEEHCLTNFSDW